MCVRMYTYVCVRVCVCMQQMSCLTYTCSYLMIQCYSCIHPICVDLLQTIFVDTAETECLTGHHLPDTKL